jgi:hypothetical protein
MIQGMVRNFKKKTDSTPNENLKNDGMNIEGNLNALEKSSRHSAEFT